MTRHVRDSERSREIQAHLGANYRILLRLRDGRSWVEASAEIAALGAQGRTGPSEGWTHTHWAMPLGQGMNSDDVRRQVFVLWGAVAVVLLIACSNLAGLMLARAGRRQREIATRMAIGSGRAAVVRQLLVESLVIATAGGLMGLLGVAVMASTLPALRVLRLDPSVTLRAE